MSKESSGYYFGAERDGQYKQVAFEDLSEEEREEALKGKSESYLHHMINIFANKYRDLSGTLDDLMNS